LNRRVRISLSLGVVIVLVGAVVLFALRRRSSAALDGESPQQVLQQAVVAQQRGQYHDAREGYLHALRLDPTLSDARYDLAVLTYSRGALLESQHHVDAFAASFPADPRIADLRKMLATPPPRQPLTVGP
jgi:hypothetical protein